MVTHGNSSVCIVRWMTILAIALIPVPCFSKFLVKRNTTISKENFHDDIMNAMGEMLHCGAKRIPRHIVAIRHVVEPMWRTMQTSTSTRAIDSRSLRYLVHRYFMKTSSLMVRGFEPSRPDTNLDAADILSQMVPAAVESVLKKKHKRDGSDQGGFDIKDVVDTIVAVDHLIHDSQSSLLEQVYANRHLSPQKPLSERVLAKVLEEYMIRWMVEAEEKDYINLLRDRTYAAKAIPHFEELMKFAAGRIQALSFDRRQHMSQDAWASGYSFEDAHNIVGSITRSFQSFWQSECSTMKASLMKMDKHNTGRVPLAKFYGTGLDTETRFGESEEYLRDIGALDESASWLGPQVIIPNYLQASSNCIVSTAHYLVCCEAECESLLGEIESFIGSPKASPSKILEIVRTMTSQTTLDQDELPHLSEHVLTQLDKIAKNHEGMVPLHSRLFAQWLHYVFPHECPLPHKNGAVSTATPAEYGDKFMADVHDMKKHSLNVTAFNVAVTKADLQWMSEWSQDEELMMDYSFETGASQWSWWPVLFVICGLLLAAGRVCSGMDGSGKKHTRDARALAALHAHFV